VGGAIFAVVLIVTVTHISGGGSDGSCVVAAPVPSLNAQLRAIGGFDQPYDPDNRQVIETVALQAASATSPDLIGASPAGPVRVASLSAAVPDAIVVPMLRAVAGQSAPRLAALVSFLRDCSGRAYFSAVDDLTARGVSSAVGFPTVSASAAAQRLGVESPQLVYATTPFMPLWRNPSNGTTIAAE